MFFLSNSSVSNFDYAKFITISIAVMALISPIVTALINNRHLRLMRDKDIQEQINNKVLDNTIEAFENYIESLSSYYATSRNVGGNYDRQIKSIETYGIASMYVSNKTRPLLDTINDLVIDRDFESIAESIPSISNLLQIEIDDIKSNRNN